MLTSSVLVIIIISEILHQNPAYITSVPAAAFGRTGIWEVDGLLFSSGTTQYIDSLGAEKSRRVEEALAEEDSKSQILQWAAFGSNPPECLTCYDIEGDISGYERAAVVRNDDSNSLIIVGVVPVNSVQANASFNLEKTRRLAEQSWEAENFLDTHVYISEILRSSAGDEQLKQRLRLCTLEKELADVTDVHLRETLLQELAEKYYEADELELSLHRYHSLYEIIDDPAPEIFDKLIELCEKTQRHATAAKFRRSAELKLQITPLPPSCVILAADFNPIIRAASDLYFSEGARLVEWQDRWFLIAVGSAPRTGEDAVTQLNTERVAVARAQREAVNYSHGSNVTVHTISTSTIVTNGKSAVEDKEWSETVQDRVKGAARNLEKVAAWTNIEADVQFIAIGAVIKDER